MRRAPLVTQEASCYGLELMTDPLVTFRDGKTCHGYGLAVDGKRRDAEVDLSGLAGGPVLGNSSVAP